MSLPVSLLIVGGGATAVWIGLTDPPGGALGAIGRVLRGEPAAGQSLAKGAAAPPNVAAPVPGYIARFGPTVWPVPSHSINTPYGVPGSWAAGHHTGVDIEAPDGTPVRSPASGTVTAAGWSGDYGIAVQLMAKLDGGRRLIMLCHLQDVQRGIHAGASVEAGQLVGHADHTGRVFSSTGGTGAHLHLEVRKAPFTYGSDIDPLQALFGYHAGEVGRRR